MELKQYTNNREQKASGISINKQKGDFTAAAYHSVSKALGALEGATKQIQEQQDISKIDALAAQRAKEAGIYKQKVLDNSRHGKVDGEKIKKYDALSPVVDYNSLGGQTIHDGMDAINSQFDTYASEHFSPKVYARYKSRVLDATVRDTLDTYATYRDEMKREQIRVAHQTAMTYISQVQIADNVVKAALGAQDNLDSFHKSLTHNSFMEAHRVDAIVTTNNNELYGTATNALIRNEKYDEAAYQLGINVDMLDAVPASQYKKYGIFWDKEHKVLSRAGSDAGRAPDSILKSGVTIKQAPKGYSEYRLKGWSTYPTAKKEAMIGAVLRGMVKKEEKDASLALAHFENITHDIFSGKADEKQMATFNTLAQKLHSSNLKPKIIADKMAEGMAALAFSNNVASMGVSTPAMIQESRAGIIKQIEGVDPKELFGDLMSNPDLASYVKDKSFKTNFKEAVLKMYDSVQQAHMKARKDDIASYGLKYDVESANAYKPLNNLSKTYANVAARLGVANEEGHLEQIKVLTKELADTATGMQKATSAYMGLASKYQKSIGVNYYDMQYLPKANVAPVAEGAKRAIDTNDTTSIMTAMSTIKGMTAGGQPALIRSFFEQQGKTLPASVQASMFLPAELQGELLANMPNVKDVMATAEGVSKEQLDKELTTNSDFDKIRTALSTSVNAKYNQRTLGSLAQMVKLGATEFVQSGATASEAIESSVKKYLNATGVVVDGQYMTNASLNMLGITAQEAPQYMRDASTMAKYMDIQPSEQTKEMWVAAAYGPKKHWKDLSKEAKDGFKQRFAADTVVVWSVAGDASFIHASTGTPVQLKYKNGYNEDITTYTVPPDVATRLFSKADTNIYNRGLRKHRQEEIKKLKGSNRATKARVFTGGRLW